MADPKPPGDIRHLAIFRVASYRFCAPAHAIAAITDVPAWTRIPKAPPSILGAVNHRGQVVVVVSLRRKLGLASRPAADRSQLIIAELATGLTGFVVDAVEDVRPPADMQRQNLAASEAIDIFDAYRVDGKRILLETTFQKLYDARESPPLKNDLETHLRHAEERLAVPEAPTVAAATPPPPADAEPVPDTPRADKHQADTPPESKRDTAPATETASRPPGGNESHFPGRPPAMEGLRTGLGIGPRQTERFTHRPPWYRYALVAALLLILTVALGAGVWLLRFNTGPRPPSPAVRAQGQRSATVQKAPQKTGAKTEREPALAAPTAPDPEVPAPSPPPDPSDLQADAKPKPTAHSQKPPESSAPDRPLASPNEVLRVEAETFTLTVERPGATSGPAKPMVPKALPATATEEIRHVVVRGDTLWDIAAHYLGDPFQYPELARLSRIRDPDLIYPDDVIRIVRRPSGN